MQIRQIRNATIKIHYGGKVFLIDPWLAPKDGFGCFAGLPESIPFKTPDSQKTFISMPICPLPTTVDERLLCRRFAKPARRWNPIARSSCKPAKRNALLSGSLQGVLSLRQINE